MVAPSLFFASHPRPIPPSPVTKASSVAHSRVQTWRRIPVAHTPLVAVIGVGFVGSGLIERFSSTYRVVGYDISKSRVAEASKTFKNNRNVHLTGCDSDLLGATVFLISVPTLHREDKSADLSYIEKALITVKKCAKAGSTVVIESSVAVGHTRLLLGPFLHSHGLFGGMSPERIDPGCIQPPMSSIPKVVSGLDDIAPGSLDAIIQIYGRVFDTLVPVSSPEVAEMTKFYEDSQRMMCVAYANEMADACQTLGINPFEVSTAAATKPFGYLPCNPSLEVEGHCIPVEPRCLFSTSDFPLLKAATKIMALQQAKIAERIITSLAIRKDG